MSLAHMRRNVPTETALHPLVNLGLVGCMVWLLAALWLAFGGAPYTALQLAVSTALAIAFVLVPVILAKMPRAKGDAPETTPFSRWIHHEFQTASGPVEGKDAAIMVVLAPASVALGITVTSLIAVLASRGLL